jgi:hypothetical protein
LTSVEGYFKGARFEDGGDSWFRGTDLVVVEHTQVEIVQLDIGACNTRILMLQGRMRSGNRDCHRKGLIMTRRLATNQRRVNLLDTDFCIDFGEGIARQR